MGAKVGFIFGCIVYGITQFVPIPDLHFLHVFFICFVLSCLVVFGATYCKPFRSCFRQSRDPTPALTVEHALVALTSWPALYPAIVGIIVLIVMLTVVLQVGSLWLFEAFVAAWLVSFIALILRPCT